MAERRYGGLTLNEIEAMAREATPGPWTNEHMEEGHLAILAGDGPTLNLVALVDHLSDDEERREVATACLIPAMRNALPALIARAREADGDGWRDISTAPKDGTEVLVALADGAVSIARWEPQKYHTKPRPYWHYPDSWGVTSMRTKQPTDWQPLPAPPAKAHEAADDGSGPPSNGGSPIDGQQGEV